MSRMNTKSVASSALTVAASILCMVLVMRPTVVSGASMVPTLHDKDVLVASPLAKRLFQPTRGDIVTVCLSAQSAHSCPPLGKPDIESTSPSDRV
jgi:signal peptidase I